jgi:uncharacterized protein YbjT (DUF2867 family)
MLRPGRFCSNALGWAPMIRRGDTVHVPWADRPAASIDPADIAGVAALALTSDGHAGLVYRLSGPQTLTPTQELAELGRMLGRTLRVVEPPPEAVRAGLLRSGMSEQVIDAVIGRANADDSFGAEVLPTVEQLLGRPARTFTDWAHAHINIFENGA